MPDDESIAAETLDRFAPVEFANADDVTGFFEEQKDRHYIPWFNETLAGDGAWAGVRLLDTPQNEIGFHQFWNQIPRVFGGPIGLVQYVADEHHRQRSARRFLSAHGEDGHGGASRDGVPVRPHP